MPPKARKQGFVAVKATGKGNTSNDTLGLNTGHRVAAPILESSVEEITQRDVKAKEAILGYARFDMVQNFDKITFGRWNARPLVEREVSNLVQSFTVNGVDRFNPRHAISIVLSKSWVKPGTLDQDIEKRDNLPILELTADFPEDGKIYATGGHHRTHGLKKW
ncbi:hypothetical protein HYDPIDRAFT_35071, partial [Hydnomerulius pinastri MD-312]